MSDLWLTLAVVADELDVSTRTVQRWVENGDLAAVRLPGGRLRVQRAELDSALERWRTVAPGRRLAAVPEEA